MSRCTHPKVFSQGYACHLANLCLMVGVQTLPIDVDDLFIDYIITLTKKSNKFQQFAGVRELNTARLVD